VKATLFEPLAESTIARVPCALIREQFSRERQTSWRDRKCEQRSIERKYARDLHRRELAIAARSVALVIQTLSD
jgi:hypothetical protein